MAISNNKKVWDASKVIARSFAECKESIDDVYFRLALILQTSEGTPAEFAVHMEAPPPQFFALRNNIFSPLFQTAYYLLDISEERRLLYAKLNRLFRIWVTSADNLLDNEDKVVVPLCMRSKSHIMHQVIAIMAADRVLKELLDEAVAKNIITPSESTLLSAKSLQILLPSAAEEGLEEKGVECRPDPDYVLYTIHLTKTSTLFQIPFLGPESIESAIDPERLGLLKQAFDSFGLGCQILDDIRDLARDYLEKKHNYILSQIFYNRHESAIVQLMQLQELSKRDNKIFTNFPEAVLPAADLAKTLLRESLISMNSLGLSLSPRTMTRMTNLMFRILDVKELL